MTDGPVLAFRSGLLPTRVGHKLEGRPSWLEVAAPSAFASAPPLRPYVLHHGKQDSAAPGCGRRSAMLFADAAPYDVLTLPSGAWEVLAEFKGAWPSIPFHAAI